ncbi:MAG: type II secretion system minor pseudopilin GspI [Candidatus Omnitrophica bacterium]|nr:type II secretion system minor pseudopilin GspI [Candidatus Omnitrophota bacterium]
MSLLNKSSGFTLIEVLVAIVILAIGLVSVIEGMARTEQAFRISQNLVISSEILEQKMTESELEVRQFHQLRTGQDKGKEQFLGQEFSWVKEVRPYVDESISDATKLNQVTIRIQWKEGSRRNNWNATTIIANREKEL